MVSFLYFVGTSSLVTSQIQVRAGAAKGCVRYSNTDDTCTNDDNGDIESEDDQVTMSDRKNRNWNVTRRMYNMRPKRRAVQSSVTIETMEEKERRQLDWLVCNTERVLGPESPIVGSMEQRLIELTYDLMNAWSRRASKKEGSRAPHVVERLLQRLVKEQDEGNDIVVIDTAVYNVLLNAWSNSCEEGSAERSEEILHQMERMFLEEGNSQVRPNEDSYNAVIKAYVKNGNRSISASKVESILQGMESRRKDTGVSPTRRSYNLFLYALANSNLEDASTQADAILQNMIDRYVEHGDIKCKPDINSYNQVLTAWARGKTSGFEDRMQAVYEEVLNLPMDMQITPNADTFNTVMGGWLKSRKPDGLKMIESVMETMERSYAAGNKACKPNRISINTLAAAYAKTTNSDAIEKSLNKTATLEKRYQVTANTISYNTVIDSWCKSARSDAPCRVIEILDLMENEFKSGASMVQPDGYTYSSVIGCFVKFNRPDAAIVAEDILQRMRDMHINFSGEAPTTSVYNSVLHAWACHKNEKVAFENVMRLFKIMDTNDGTDRTIPKPNRITYNTVIKAMRGGSVENAQMAEKILLRLETMGQSDPSLLPDSYSYSSVITAYGRSNAANKAPQALKILERMIRARELGNMGAITTTHSFNAALNACAFVIDDRERRVEAFDIAMQIYDMLKEKAVADHTTYGTLLRIFATLLEPTDTRRPELVGEFFKKACSTGNVGRLVLTQLKFAATSDQFEKLTGLKIEDRINVNDLPRSWTRNVRETTRRQS